MESLVMACNKKKGILRCLFLKVTVSISYIVQLLKYQSSMLPYTVCIWKCALYRNIYPRDVQEARKTARNQFPIIETIL